MEELQVDDSIPSPPVFFWAIHRVEDGSLVLKFDDDQLLQDISMVGRLLVVRIGGGIRAFRSDVKNLHELETPLEAFVGQKYAILLSEKSEHAVARTEDCGRVRVLRTTHPVLRVRSAWFCHQNRFAVVRYHPSRRLGEMSSEVWSLDEVSHPHNLVLQADNARAFRDWQGVWLAIHAERSNENLFSLVDRQWRKRKDVLRTLHLGSRHRIEGDLNGDFDPVSHEDGRRTDLGDNLDDVTFSADEAYFVPRRARSGSPVI